MKTNKQINKIAFQLKSDHPRLYLLMFIWPFCNLDLDIWFWPIFWSYLGQGIQNLRAQTAHTDKTFYECDLDILKMYCVPKIKFLHCVSKKFPPLNSL